MLSIIIPTHNEENYLPRLLQSIKNQEFSDYEIIVADADSKDRTREIARDFGAKVVSGGMPAVGRNRGAAAATGDLFLFLDADVVLSPSVIPAGDVPKGQRFPVTLRDITRGVTGGEKSEFLERVTDEFGRKNFGIATCRLIPASRRFIDKFFHAVYDFYVSKMARIMPHAPGFFILIKRDLFLQIGGFDEGITLCEDTDLTIRAAKKGKFGFLRAEKIKVSVRRFDADGRWNVAFKYLLAEMILLLGKRIRGWPKYNLFYKK